MAITALPTLQQKLLLEHLRHTRGSPVSVERLVAALYGSRADGGPEYAAKVVTTQMSKLRRWLGPSGVQILTIGLGRGAEGYMIDPEHLDRVEEIVAVLSQLAIDVARSR